MLPSRKSWKSCLLPHTSGSLRDHDLDLRCLNPLEWVFLSCGTLESVFTNFDIVPDAQRNFVKCKCKTECTSKMCLCRKAWFEMRNYFWQLLRGLYVQQGISYSELNLRIWNVNYYVNYYNTFYQKCHLMNRVVNLCLVFALFCFLFQGIRVNAWW